MEAEGQETGMTKPAPSVHVGGLWMFLRGQRKYLNRRENCSYKVGSRNYIFVMELVGIETRGRLPGQPLLFHSTVR